MNKNSYTAYLPEPRVTTRKRESSANAYSHLDDCFRRLDVYDRKLVHLNDECLTNLRKCNKYYTIARNLTNKKYAATTNISANYTAVPGDGRRYYPGDGRSVYVGVEAKFD